MGYRALRHNCPLPLLPLCRVDWVHSQTLNPVLALVLQGLVSRRALGKEHPRHMSLF